MDISSISKVNSNINTQNTKNAFKATKTEFSSLLDNKIGSNVTLEDVFKSAANTYSLDVNLLKAVAKVESNFNPNALSNLGASGIMQLMPSAAEALGVTDTTDAAQNVMGGANLLASLLNKYSGDKSLALAAYYSGSGAVDRAGGVPSYAESYVKKVLSNLNEKYDLSDTAYTGPSNLNSVDSILSTGTVGGSARVTRDNVSNITYMTKEDYEKKVAQDKLVTSMIMNIMSATMGTANSSASALSSLGLGSNTISSLGLDSDTINSLGLDSATLSALGLSTSSGMDTSAYLNMLSSDDDDSTDDYMIY